MGWTFLILAIVCEIAWGLTLKSTQGYTRLVPSSINLIIWVILIYSIASAAEFFPITIVYPTWTGLGAVGITVGSVLIYRETINWRQIFFTIIIAIGVTGLEIG